jgi:hypothetical protein
MPGADLAARGLENLPGGDACSLNIHIRSNLICNIIKV